MFSSRRNLQGGQRCGAVAFFPRIGVLTGCRAGAIHRVSADDAPAAAIFVHMDGCVGYSQDGCDVPSPRRGDIWVTPYKRSAVRGVGGPVRPPRHAGGMIEPDGRYAAEERGGG